MRREVDRLPVNLRTRLQPLVQRYGPRALALAGMVKGLSVAALAPLVGVPMAPTLVVAGLWAGGPSLVAIWWTRRAHRAKAVPLVPPVHGTLAHTR